MTVTVSLLRPWSKFFSAVGDIPFSDFVADGCGRAERFALWSSRAGRTCDTAGYVRHGIGQKGRCTAGGSEAGTITGAKGDEEQGGRRETRNVYYVNRLGLWYSASATILCLLPLALYSIMA